MSFHWNLSSDEEEVDDWLDDGTKGHKGSPSHIDTKLPAINATPQTPLTASTKVVLNPEFSDGDGDDDDNDEVDWEDAEDDDEHDLDSKAPNRLMPLQPVTIDFLQQIEDSTTATTRKRKYPSRRVYRYRSLPSDLQSLLSLIHDAHMLTLISRAVLLSKCSSDYTLLHTLHSLIPSSWAFREEVNVPTERELRQWTTWFFDLVNRTPQRRRQLYAAHVAAGAPVIERRRLRGNRGYAPSSCGSTTRKVQGQGVVDPDHFLKICSYLSSDNDHDPQLNPDGDVIITEHDKSQVMVSMARSIGWRARYVVALEPIKHDLDINHPLFQSGAANVFLAVSQQKTTPVAHYVTSRASRIVTNSGKNKEPTNQSSDAEALSLGDPLQAGREFGWVEILCQSSKVASKGRNNKQQFRWIHVDPSHELVDQPDVVESIFHAIHHDCAVVQKRNKTMSYALAIEHLSLADNNPESTLFDKVQDSWDLLHQIRLTDVTPRYAHSWSQSLKLRGPQNGVSSWWSVTIKQINAYYRNHAQTALEQCLTPVSNKVNNEPPQFLIEKVSIQNGKSSKEAILVDNPSDEDGDTNGHDFIECDETVELHQSAAREAIPTSKAAFNNHPVYSIPSVLNANEVLAPDAKSRVCGIFKGEMVYLRSDVSTALAAKKWLYQGRKVQESEMRNPVKRVKARKKPTPKGFTALRSYGVGTGNDGSQEARNRDIALGSQVDFDGMDDLYAIWQTMPWSPVTVGPMDTIPVNEYNNVELALLNPGLTHLEEPRMAIVAKKLGIPYAPCLLGFEGHGGNRTPSIRGIVVHDHNMELLREAHAEFVSQALEQEHDERRKKIYTRWKRLIVGLLTKDRLERAYGDE